MRNFRFGEVGSVIAVTEHHRNEDCDDDELMCVIDGRADDPVTKGELKLFVRRVFAYRLRPMNTKIDQMHSALFDEQTGIMPTIMIIKTMRRWICLAATWTAALILAGMTLIDRLIAHGWWFK